MMIRMIKNLQTVEDGLRKDKRESEILSVYTNKILLDYIRDNGIQSLQFVYKNTKYWEVLRAYFSSLFVGEPTKSVEQGYAINIFHNLYMISYKIEDGAKKDNQLETSLIAGNIGNLTVQYFVPYVVKHYDLVEKYKEYKKK